VFTSIPRSKKSGSKYPVEDVDPETWGLRIRWPDIDTKLVFVPGGVGLLLKSRELTVYLAEESGGRLRLRVWGRTYERRQQLKRIGLRWDPYSKEWRRLCKTLEEAMDYFVKVVNEVL